MRQFKSFQIWSVAVIHWYFINEHFGWNRRAGSDMELIADGMALIIVAMGWMAWKPKDE